MRPLWVRLGQGVLMLALLCGCSAPTPAFTTTVSPTPVRVVVSTRTPTETVALPPTATPTGPGQRQEAGTPQPVTATPSPSPTPDPRLCLPAAPSEVGEVAWVINGEVIVVRIDGRLRSVRYLGLQAPAYLPNIAFMGPPAFRKNQELVQHQVVNLYRDGADQDELGQLLRYVTTHEMFINYELVRLGFARAAEPGILNGLACQTALLQGQTAAQAEQMGVWTPAETAMVQGETGASPAGTPGELQEPTKAPTTAVPISTSQAGPTATSSLTPSPTGPAGTATITLTPSGSQTATGTITLSATETLQHTQTTTPVPGHSTATRTLTPTITATFTGTPDLYLDDFGFVGKETNQPDEYVQITNQGDGKAQLQGYRLYSPRLNKSFTFPAFVLEVEASCRAYTNVIRSDSCGNASFNSPTQLWLDTPARSDCVQLLDINGQQIDQICN